LWAFSEPKRTNAGENLKARGKKQKHLSLHANQLADGQASSEKKKLAFFARHDCCRGLLTKAAVVD
jgi:hypothetical protein